MTETQKRIRELKKALPAARERIVAVAALLSLSLTMMASVSYAWYTLSFSPEVGGIHTTISANGNLEVALSDKDGLEPDSSALNDSFAADGQTVHGANTTWGNLINLANNYGLESLILRPAKFDANSSVFLSGAQYGDDGRLEGITTDFYFTSWQKKEGTMLDEYEFSIALQDAFGVRAISSVGFKSGDKGELLRQVEAAEELMVEARGNYQSIMKNPEHLSAITVVVQTYLNVMISDKLDGSLGAIAGGMVGEVDDNPDITAQVPQLVKLYDDVLELCIKKAGTALATLANIQQLAKSTDGKIGYEFTADTLYSQTTQYSKQGINLGKDTYTTYRTIYQNFRDYRKTLQELYDAAIASDTDDVIVSIDDPKVSAILTHLIDVTKANIEGQTMTYWMSGTNALPLFTGTNSGDTIEVELTSGDIYKFELLSGEYMDTTLTGLSIGENKTNLSGHLTTTARGKGSLFAGATSVTKEIDPAARNNLVAQDTYGMVLDLWFRTNSGGNKGALLTLDGTPNVTYDYEVYHISPPKGEKTPVFIYNRPIGDPTLGETVEIGVYCVPADRNDDKVIDERVFDPDGDPSTDNSVIAYEGYYYSESDFSMINKTVYVTGADGATTPSEDTSLPINLADISGPKIKVIPIVHGYETSNRVWDDVDVGLGADEISTTQGSGSCYVFYASTPTEAANAIEMLRNLKLAFVDANGTLLATAVLDVDYTFASAGKYLVPITIKESDYYAYNKQGEKVYGFANLTKNVATRISIVAYLEGENLENNMVLTSGSINGRLNLQFSTVDDLLAMGDSALENSTISLSATLNNGTNKVDAAYIGSEITVNVRANVSGLSANKVQAAFMRKINDSQGRQMQIVDLERQTDENNNIFYSAAYGFNAPGEYVLRSLIVDGVTYDLPGEELVVSISGLQINAASFCDNNDGTALTTDNFVTRPVSVQLGAGWEIQNVTAHFASVDGNKQVSASLTKDGDYWKGTARFTSSGEYYLAFVEVDSKIENGKYVPGEYFNVPESMQGRLNAKLGLRASVLLNSSRADIAYEFTGRRNIEVSATILTDTGEPLNGLSDVWIYYVSTVSSIQGDELPQTKLTWQNGVYSGVFNIENPGAYYFDRIEIGTIETSINTIRTVSSAPTIVARPKDPPVYLGYTTSYAGTERQKYIVMSNNTSGKPLVITTIENAVTATAITAIFEHTDANGVTQQLTAVWDRTKYIATDNKITFELPAVPNNDSHNGKWELVEIHLVDVYDETGKLYDAEDPYILEIGDAEFAVLERFDVTIDTLTPSKPNGDAAFMEQQKITLGANGVNISLNQYTALLAESGLSIKNAKILLTHQARSNETHGYYSFTGTLSEQSKSIALTDPAEDGKSVFFTDTYIALAGVYDASVTFDVYDGETKLGSFQSRETFVNKLTVKSAKPEVKVSSTDPSPGTTKRVYTVSEPTTADQAVTGDFFKKTDYSAVVYIYTNTSSGWFDQEAAHAYAPKVTLSLSGVSAGSGISMKFTKQHEDSSDSVFNFTDGKKATASVGKSVDGKQSTLGVSDYPELYPAGRMTQNQITLTYENVQITVNLKHEIVLDNPMAPTVMVFTGIPDSYTGTKPAQVTGNGSTVTVTLPRLEWTAVIEKPQAGTWSAFTNAGEVTDANGDPVGRVYGYRYYTSKNSCGGTDEHHEYQYYIWTKFQSSITASTDIYHQAKRITRWKINGQYYDAGTEVSISGEGIITAEAVVVDVGAETFVETKEQTTTRTQYGYVQESSTRTSKNGGSQIGSQVGQNAAFPKPLLADATKAKANNDETKDVLGTNMTKDSAAYSQYHP